MVVREKGVGDGKKGKRVKNYQLSVIKRRRDVLCSMANTIITTAQCHTASGLVMVITSSGKQILNYYVVPLKRIHCMSPIIKMKIK